MTNFDTAHRAWEASWINGPDELETEDLSAYTLDELLRLNTEFRESYGKTCPIIDEEIKTRPDPFRTEIEFDPFVGWVGWNAQLAPHQRGLTTEQAKYLRDNYKDLALPLHPQITFYPWWLPHVLPISHTTCIRLVKRALDDYQNLLLNG